MRTRLVLSFLLVIILGVFLVSCESTPHLTSISITPTSASLGSIGAQQQYTASAYYARSSHPPTITDVTAQVSWTSSNPSVATVDSSGIATAVGVGTATITANMDGFSAIAAVNVTITAQGGGGSRTLNSISIIPNSQPLNTLGETAQFIAVGTYSAPPTTENLAGQVNWESSDPSVATIDPASGLATAVGCGTSSCVTTITAMATADSGGTVIGTANLSVSPGSPQPTRVLSAITILPGSGTQTVYKVGETSQFIAIGTYTASPVTQDITDIVTWASSDVDLATIDTAGLATAVSCSLPAPQVCVTNITAAANLGANESLVVATSNLNVSTNGGTSNLPSLTVYLLGAAANTGRVVSTPAGINCTAGSVTGCTAFFPLGSSVTLTATPAPPALAGWSANCTPNNANPCTVSMGTNQSVGAIFN